ncbi:hypothetical protein B0A48_18684 [Cryoendolithus antarcticus]|uniref:Uncharacterized protein n=1 Tax=Cryoendolithus antarcticus TaxID=1507870 RepID=A0A1V8S847_9PEZI|nr:hypothetical protein B0A48_18684 [Cryoendolithus antarcticus]
MSPAKLLKDKDPSKGLGYIWKLPLEKTQTGLHGLDTGNISTSELPISTGDTGGQPIGNTLSTPIQVSSSRLPMETSAASVLLETHDGAGHKRKWAEHISSSPNAAMVPPEARRVRGIPHIVESDSSDDDTDDHTEDDQPATTENMSGISIAQQSTATSEGNNAAHGRALSQDEARAVDLGKLVVLAQGLKQKYERLELNFKNSCSEIPDLEELAHTAEQKSKEAQELAKRAEAIRLQADAAKADLEVAKEATRKLTAAKEEMQKIQQERVHVLEQLGID